MVPDARVTVPVPRLLQTHNSAVHSPRGGIWTVDGEREERAASMEPPQPCLEEEEFLAPKSVWAELKAKLVPRR